MSSLKLQEGFINTKATIKGKMTMKISVHSNTLLYITLQLLQYKNNCRELNSLANLSQLAREEELLSEVILKGPYSRSVREWYNWTHSSL